MQSMAISQFKAQCLAVLERVRSTGEPLVVTRFGKPVAQIDPVPAAKPQRLFGAMKGRIEFMGDIISPVGVEDWEALKE